ncbi:MAG: hypothetical protein IPP11_14650 [Chitinophagaceae bacterium]|nr:hypothetical protein [Chitinophagaceae bacterium]
MYRQCTLSVMDNIADPDISFDEKGICNYYYEYQQAAENTFLKMKPKAGLSWSKLPAQL